MPSAAHVKIAGLDSSSGNDLGGSQVAASKPSLLRPSLGACLVEYWGVAFAIEWWRGSCRVPGLDSSSSSSGEGSECNVDTYVHSPGGIAGTNPFGV